MLQQYFQEFSDNFHGNLVGQYLLFMLVGECRLANLKYSKPWKISKENLEITFPTCRFLEELLLFMKSEKKSQLLYGYLDFSLLPLKIHIISDSKSQFALLMTIPLWFNILHKPASNRKRQSSHQSVFPYEISHFHREHSFETDAETAKVGKPANVSAGDWPSSIKLSWKLSKAVLQDRYLNKGHGEHVTL